MKKRYRELEAGKLRNEKVHRIAERRIVPKCLSEDFNARSYPNKEYKGDCWWCKYSFENEAVGFPLKYNTVMSFWEMFGFFCSYECALAYNNDKPNKNVSVDSNLFSILKCTFRDYKDVIKPAQHWSILEKFGGTMEIDEFRSNINAKYVDYHTTETDNCVPIGWIFYLRDKECSEFKRFELNKLESTIDNRKPERGSSWKKFQPVKRKLTPAEELRKRKLRLKKALSIRAIKKEQRDLKARVRFAKI